MSKVLRCISPVDDSVYCERPEVSASESGAAVAAAAAAQRSWVARSLAERVEIVRDGSARLGAMAAAAVPELAWMMGRPVRHGGEFGGVRERVEYMATIAAATLAPLVVEDSARMGRQIAREPRGVVLVIAPWNYPYLTAINTIAPALIAGNAVILKHATQTLLAGERLAAAFHAAGVPAAVFQNLCLARRTVGQLIRAGLFDFVNFTGSVAGGRAIEKAAAGTFTSLGLELGGKDPAYVMEDADLDQAASALAAGAFYNSGQCCCGIERVYVSAPLFEDFLERLIVATAEYKLGNPLDETTTLGPMAHKRFAEGVRAQIAAAVGAGARCWIEPSLFPSDDGGSYLMPQILTGVSHDMDVMREESFGPVVGLMPVANDDEAVALMNDSSYGLTASLWTEDEARAMKIGTRIETGTVFMNRCDYLDPALCWTGCKDTGRGGSMSAIGYHNLTRPKSYHMKKKSAA